MEKTVKDFIEYFNDFYDLKTANPIYSGITDDKLEKAILFYINNGSLWADGDSVDREKVLAILLTVNGADITYNRRKN